MAKKGQTSGNLLKGAAKTRITQRSNTGEISEAGKTVKTGRLSLRSGVASEAKRLLEEKGYKPWKTANNAILGKENQRPESKLTSLEKMELAGHGISKKNLEQLKDKAALNYDQLAEVLSVSRATLINKKENFTFNQELSEKIVAIAAIYSYGYEVFEDKERFNNWISQPNRALGYKAPYELLSSSFGREEVMAVIGRIDYGVYS